MGSGDDDVRPSTAEELRSVEAEIERVRQAAASLRASVGGRADGPTDPEETAAVIRSAEEQEALAEILDNRRESLLRRLG